MVQGTYVPRDRFTLGLVKVMIRPRLDLLGTWHETAMATNQGTWGEEQASAAVARQQEPPPPPPP